MIKRLIATVLITFNVASGGQLVDQLDTAEHFDVQQHQFYADGKTSTDLAGDFVGGHDMRRKCHVVRSGSASYVFRCARGRPATIEVEEVDGREIGTRGYSLFVNEKRVYFRTWRCCGAGPVHYFVQIPPPESDHITLRIENRADVPVAVSRIWLFSDLPALVQANEMDVPYYLAPTLHLKWNDFDVDLEKLRKTGASFGEHFNARPAWTTWIGYASLDDREVASRLDYVIRLAEQTNLPVQISFDSWWGFTPAGTDGHGGFFGDVQYQQVVYNSTERRFQLSVPNQWSNTPWLTVNNPILNSHKAARLKAAASILSDRYDALRAAGKAHLILAVNLDNEPVYWASGNAGLGAGLLEADFNPLTVVAAQRDGVKLDPTDGLSRDERLWLRQNLLNYNTMIGAAATDGLGRGSGIVTRNGVIPCDDPLSENVYTQAMVANSENQYPMLNAAYPFWETAAPEIVRCGGEWNSSSVAEYQAVLHQIALGRSADVNAEAGNDILAIEGVRSGYALAQRYYALYNYPLDQMRRAAAELDDLRVSLPTRVFEPVLSEFRFDNDEWRTTVVDSGDLDRGVIGNTAITAIYSESAEKVGFLTWRITPPHQEKFAGLNVELSGRSFVQGKKDSDVYIRVLAGEHSDPASMHEVGRISDVGDLNALHRFDLSQIARDREEAFVRIEFHAPHVRKPEMSWCAISSVRFMLPWPEGSFAGLPPQDESIGMLRQQNLIVSWRRDAERAIASCSAEIKKVDGDIPGQVFDSLAKARKSFEEGQYAQAYRAASVARSNLLPVSFYVAESGPLDPYPLRVETSRPVYVTLQKCSEREVVATTRCDGDPVEVTVLRPSGEVALRLRARRRAACDEAPPAPLEDSIVQGVVKRFMPLDPFTMPQLQLESESVPRVIQMEANFHLEGKLFVIKSKAVGAPLLVPGQHVRLRIAKSSGRVMEVWNLDDRP